MPAMKSTMIDTHAHLDMSHFDADREEVISRAFRAGVTTIINVGLDLDSSRESIGLAEKYDGIFAAVGVHPHDAEKVKKEDIDTIAEIAAHPRAVAIGETGLDFYRDYSSRESQQRVFEWQLGLAKRLKMPVIIHSRRADTETLSTLREWASGNITERIGVIHCFSGDVVMARNYLEMGFFIAFGAYVTYPSSANIREVVSKIPDDRLLVETDCPFLPPQGHRGERNEPACIPDTVEMLAGMRGMSPEKIAEKTIENAINLFRLPVV